MRLEIPIPDGMTFAEFKNAKPPDGVKVQVHIPPEAQQNSLDVSVSISVTLDVAATVKSVAVAAFVLSAFKHHLRKYPKAQCTISRRHVELEEAPIVRLIDQVRETEHIQHDGAEEK